MYYPEIKRLTLMYLGQDAWSALDQLDSSQGNQAIIKYLGVEKEQKEYKDRLEKVRSNSRLFIKEVNSFRDWLRKEFFKKLEAAIVKSN